MVLVRLHSKLLFYRLVTGEVADVISRTGHFPGVDGNFCGEPSDETAWCIDTATLGNALVKHFQILLPVIVERRAAPVTFLPWRESDPCHPLLSHHIYGGVVRRAHNSA